MDFLGAIGKLLGSIFEDKRKKPQQQQPQQLPQPAQNNSGTVNVVNGNRPVQNTPIQQVKPKLQPSINTSIINAPKPVSLQPQQPKPAIQAPQPVPQVNIPNGATQPQQKPASAPTLNDIGNFIGNGTAKLANTGLAIGEKVGVHAQGGIQKLLGDKAGGDRTIQQGEQSINQRLLRQGGGLFGAGGIYNSLDQLHNADTGDVIRKAGGTGLQAASELLPIGKGVGLIKGAAPLANKVVEGAVQGAAGSGVGSVGSQLAQNGKIDPLETAKATGIGALLGGGIPLAGEVAKGATGGARIISDATQSRVNEITRQPGYNSQAGFAKLPGKAQSTPSQNVTPMKESSFKSSTVPASDNVSQELKSVISSQPKALYNGVTNRQHLQTSLKNLQDKGIEGLTQDVSNKLSAKPGHIDSQTVADTLSAAQTLDLNGDPASLDKAAELYDSLSKHLTASGQTTQAASLILRRSPEGLQLGAYRQLQKAGVPLTPEIRSQIQQDVSRVKSSPEGSQQRQDAVANFIKNVGANVPQSAINNLTGVWKAGLLSGVKTQGGNFISNATFNGLRKASDPLAAAIDKVLSLRTGERAKTFTMRGIAEGASEGIQNGMYTMKTGIDRRNLANTMDKYEQHSEINFKNPAVQRVIGNPANLVFRGMSAADQPFYYAALKNNMYDIAKADGINRGLSGSQLVDYMDNFVANPPQEALQVANNEAEKAVLGNDTFASKAISGLKRGIENTDFSPAGKAAANAFIDRVAPFTKVPSAFLSRVIDYTPAGPIKTIASQIARKKFDQRALSTAISEGITGSGIIYLGAELANNDMLSGDYPDNPTEQARWKAAGIQPNSIKLGDTWYSLNYLGPLGLLFGAGKNIHDAAKNGDNQAIAAAAGVGKGLMGQSFLQGFTGFGNAIQDPGRYGQNLINSQISSSVPSISNDIANATDEYQRQADNPLQAAESRIPGLRQSLAPKQDAFGNELKQPSGGINAAINPLKPSSANSSPLMSELDRLSKVGQGTFPTDDKTIIVGKETVKLTPDQQREYNKTSGQDIQKAWETITNDDAYKSLSDDQKKKWLDNAASDISNITKKQYLEKLGRNDLADKVKLTDDQKQYANGGSDPNIWKPRSSGQSPSAGGTENLPSSDTSNKLLNYTSTLSKADKKTWLGRDVEGKYNSLIDEADKLHPADIPSLPRTNKVAELYANLQKDIADNPDWTDLQKGKKQKSFIADAYDSTLTDNQKTIASLSSKDLQAAIAANQVTKEDTDKIAALDEVRQKLGLTPYFSKKDRAALGYAALPSIGGSSGGRKTGRRKGSKVKKISYKNSFNRVGSAAAIRKLLQSSGKGIKA